MFDYQRARVGLHALKPQRWDKCRTLENSEEGLWFANQTLWAKSNSLLIGTNVVKTIINHTPFLMVYSTIKSYGDDWGMVYSIVSTTLLSIGAAYNLHPTRDLANLAEPTINRPSDRTSIPWNPVASTTFSLLVNFQVSLPYGLQHSTVSSPFFELKDVESPYLFPSETPKTISAMAGPSRRLAEKMLTVGQLDQGV